MASDSVRVLMDDEEIYSRSVASWHELSNVCPVGTPIAFGVGVHDGIAAFTGFEVRAGGANHKPSVTQNNPSQRPPSPSPQNQETPETASKRAYKLNVSDETYIGQPYNDPSHPRPQSDTFFFVESDQSFGKIRWQFRLPPTVDEIRAASLSFHTIDDYRASTTAPFGVWSRNQQVGALPEAEADTWITVPLDFAQIGVSTEFELELRGGNNALVVHGQKSGFAPYLTIEATTLTNGPKGSMADVPQLVLRITNYQKTRATQLTELTTKYQRALTSAKKEAEKFGATKSVSVIDLAIQRAKAYRRAIEALPKSIDVASLDPLPPLSSDTPASLQRLRSIFDTETAKIETDLLAKLHQSLDNLETQFLETSDLEGARAVETYRGGLPPHPQMVEVDSSSITLMNLDSWHRTGSANWSLADDTFTASGPGTGDLYQILPFDDFELEGEIMVSKEGNGGISFAAHPPGSGDAYIDSGLQFQLCGSEMNDKRKTGSLLAMKLRTHPHIVDKSSLEDGAWGSFKIRYQAGRVLGWLKDEKLFDENVPEAAKDGLGRVIALEHFKTGTVGYRNLRIRSLKGE